ncbi:ABC transporter ATP-binding protein/permease [Thiomonas intermedia]|uniref:ABC transporter ATP-binding protein/permease n=1 Tax=Thiomonas intermedia TaxID=926 RepID=UPI0009A4E291|nr:ABC transporter ATP-binding protein/permease [Thiomonas intermedia]
MQTQPTAQSYRFAFRHFYALAKPYLVSEEKKKGWGLLLLVLAMNLALVWVNVKLTQWNGDFFNALQAKNFGAFKQLLLIFTGYAFLYIALAVYSQYFLQMLQISWRRWMTEVFLKDWLAGGTHYRMSLRQGNTDNPDQRIADDIGGFINGSLNLFFGFVSSLVTLFSFLFMLWVLSGAITLFGITIPGYMVWVALLYAGVGSVLAHWVGKPLIRLNFFQQRYEADFRFGLARTREHDEGIALYNGEARELAGHRSRFANVWSNWWGIMKRQKLFTWYSAFYGQLAIIFPILVAAPRYFAGQIQLGGLTQTSQAFGQVQGALSWFIGAYTSIADWRATVERLQTFVDAMHQSQQNPHDPAPASPAGRPSGTPPTTAGVVPLRSARESVALGDLLLLAPDGRPLLQCAGEHISRGQHTLFTGPSGSGKSTLVRWLAGIWPYALNAAHAHAPSGRTLFLPQKPYLPLGTLKQALTYPQSPDDFSAAQISEALQLARVPYLEAALEQTDTWMQRLSPGEQQRLAVARALLIAPDWLFMDEATSALDAPTERAMYALLQQRLPEATLVSVAHRVGVIEFHAQIYAIDVDPTRQGPARIERRDAEQARKAALGEGAIADASAVAS